MLPTRLLSDLCLFDQYVHALTCAASLLAWPTDTDRIHFVEYVQLLKFNTFYDTVLEGRITDTDSYRTVDDFLVGDERYEEARGPIFRFSTIDDLASRCSVSPLGDGRTHMYTLNSECHTGSAILIHSIAIRIFLLGPNSGRTDYLRVGKLSHYVTSHPGQLSLAIPPWVGAMSTGDGYGHR